ncbi:hypothetical protein [Paenibacillus sp. RUD330]|uniref:hypothetical protein n=1 Tax=Paenibacillus sp. RUD330 TaxID=2023772 RepID=UPI0012FD6F52|nr:hypothetical protein [Paenibacillus sp. RUD330]ASS66207.2 hypothetical protein CIC07_08645 [Paenibacillus sp. RUD330]
MLTASQLANQAEIQRKAKAGIPLTNPTASSTALYKQTQTTANPGLQKVAQPVKPITASSLMAQPGEAGVRKYFNDNGYSNVGYDKARGMVTVNGMDALAPSRIAGGTSYASNDALAASLSKVRNTEMGNKVNGQLANIEELLKKPSYTPGQFNYDASADPIYQAALARAKTNAQGASGDAMAELNKRGILDSTITGDRVAGIQQDAVNQVDSELIPQLTQQAYQRWQNEENMKYQQSRDSVGDAGNLLSQLMGVDQANRGNDQQQWDNRFQYGQAIGQFGNGQQTLQNKQNQENMAYQRARDAIGDKQWQAQFDQSVKQFGLNYALQQLSENNQAAYQQAQIALSQDDNLRQWSQLDATLAQQNAPQAPKYSGMSSSQVVSSIRTQLGDNLAKTPKDQIYQQVVAFGLPDGQDEQAMLALGLTKADIQALDKKFGVGAGKP